MKLITNKPLFVSSLEKINKLLHNEVVKPGFIFFGKRYAIQYNRFKGKYSPNKIDNQILVIRPTTIMNGFFYESFDNVDILSNIYFSTYFKNIYYDSKELSKVYENNGIEYETDIPNNEDLSEDNELFIEAWYIHNCDFLKPHLNLKILYPEKQILSDDEIMKHFKSIIYYIKTIARKENKKKILLDVCQEIFTNFFEKEGFIPTGKIVMFNSFNFTMNIELVLDEDYFIK